MLRERMSEGKKNIITELLDEYEIKTTLDLQSTLKDLIGGTVKEMLESEPEKELGYEKYEKTVDAKSNYRNGHKAKKFRSSMEA